MAYANDVAALNDEQWANMMQDNLYKELVAVEIADTKFKTNLKTGKQVHFPMFGALSTTAYVKGTDVTVQALDSTDEYLSIDQQYESSFYVDEIDKRQNKYSAMQSGLDEARYAIRDDIDASVLAQTVNAYDTLDTGDISAADAGAGTGIALTTSNVVQVFSVARQKLQENNVRENGDFVAVVTPAVVSVISQKATDSGFSIADAAFKNGYAGKFQGFKIYTSNNLDITTNSSANCYIGKSKMISLGMQIAPTVKTDSDPLKFGDIVKVLAVWGRKVFTKQGQRFLNMQIASAV